MREQLLNIYLEVYKLHQPPKSSPGEPAILDEIMASVPGHPNSGGTKLVRPQCSFILEAPTHLGAVPPYQQRRDDSIDKRLATMHRVHQKALAAMATLEEEIERLSCTWAHLKSRARSNSRYCQRLSREGWKKRCCQV